MRNEDDERRVKVQLTDKGIELKEHFNQISEDVISQFNMNDDFYIVNITLCKVS